MYVIPIHIRHSTDTDSHQLVALYHASAYNLRAN